MKRLIKVLTGAAGIAAVAGFASPAAAQYYPGYGGYGDNGGGVIGAIINSVIGYGRYPYGNYGYGQGGYGFDGQQQAVNVCARAAEAKINGYGYNQGGYGGYDGYSRGYDNGYGYNGGYNGSGYNGGYGAQGRVVGISRVNRKNYGWHVYGVASTLPGGAPNLRIDCKVNRGPYVREVQVRRNMDGYRYGSGW